MAVANARDNEVASLAIHIEAHGQVAVEPLDVSASKGEASPLRVPCDCILLAKLQHLLWISVCRIVVQHDVWAAFLKAERQPFRHAGGCHAELPAVVSNAPWMQIPLRPLEIAERSLEHAGARKRMSQ